MGVVAEYLEQSGEAELGRLTELGEAEKEALLEVLCLAVYADGYADDEELGLVVTLVAEIPSFAASEGEALRSALSAAAHRVLAIEDEASANAMLERIAGSLQGEALREVAFGMAVVIALADGIVVGPEKTLLAGLIRVLGISSARVEEIVAEARQFAVGGP